MYSYQREKLHVNLSWKLKKLKYDVHILGCILRVYKLERQLKTPDKFLHPCFESINWYAAVYLLDKIKGKETVYIHYFVFSSL